MKVDDDVAIVWCELYWYGVNMWFSLFFAMINFINYINLCIVVGILLSECAIVK